MNNILREKLLELESSILIGSRGLGVGTEKSDYDIAVLKSEVPSGLLDNLTKLKIKNYSKILPLNNTELHRSGGIDVLVYEDISQISVVKNAMNDIKRVPKYLLEDKYTRVLLFESALDHYGFTRDEEVSFVFQL